MASRMLAALLAALLPLASRGAALGAPPPAYAPALASQLAARPSVIDYDPVASANATVVSTDRMARFTVLAPCLIRMEQAKKPGAFEDRATLAAVNRALPVPRFTADTAGATLRVTTDCVSLAYVQGQPFSAASLVVTSANASSAFARWAFGDAFPGNLLGTIRGLDGQSNTTLNCTENAGVDDNGEANHCEWGLVSRDGWAVYNDTTNYVLDENDWWVNNTEPDPERCFAPQPGNDAGGSSRSTYWPNGDPNATTPDACCAACLAAEDCVAWVLETTPGGRCWPLKSASGPQPAPDRTFGQRVIVDKTTQNADAIDLYGFFHGHDYFGALADFVLVGGRAAMVPRAASGVWWSRWDNINNANVVKIVDDYNSRQLPLDVYILDMDWHT